MEMEIEIEMEMEMEIIGVFGMEVMFYRDVKWMEVRTEYHFQKIIGLHW